MANNFDRYFQDVLVLEATSYEDVPGDSGGPTKCGITIADVARWNGVRCPARGAKGWDELVAKVRALTPETARPIYKRFYWDDVRADELPAGVDYATVDYAVNSGPGKAVPTLAKLVGAVGLSRVSDEVIAATAAYGHRTDLVNHFQDERKAYLLEISEYPKNRKFKRGWLAREAKVRATALEMAAAAPPVEATPVPMGKAMDTSAVPAEGWGTTVSTVNDLADQGSRVASAIRRFKDCFHWGHAVGVPATVAGAAEAGVSWWTIGAVAIGVLTLSGVVYWGIKRIERGLASAAKDGRYLPQPS